MNETKLVQLLHAHPWFRALTEAAAELEKKYFSAPEGGVLHIGAGAIQQTVWNHAHGYTADYGLRDIDIVYFEASEAPDRPLEKSLEAHLQSALAAHVPWPLDVKNQALVHIWYKARFGQEIYPYRSLEAAIATWPTTSTAIAVPLCASRPRLIAPFGLQDLSALVVRANRRQITEQIYAAKVARWHPLWPNLTILPWCQGVGGEAPISEPLP